MDRLHRLFRTKISQNQAGWMVRGQDAQHGYLFILNASDDTAGNSQRVAGAVGIGHHVSELIANVPLAQSD